MKLKFGLVLIIVIYMLSYISCEFLFGNEDEEQNGDGDKGSTTLENPYKFTAKDGSTIRVFYHLPAVINNNTRIFIAMHGNERTTNAQLSTWTPLVESDNLILIAPEFTAEQFNSHKYQGIGIRDNIAMPENWTSKIIDDIFLDFNTQHNLTIDKYILFGHSAGAQFTHRALMFSESNYLDFAIAANAGTYSFPNLYTNHMNGIRDVFPFHKNLIHRNYGRGLYILIGELDTVIDEEADDDAPAGGRLGLARRFFNESKEYCEFNNLFFNWELREMPDVGHSTRQTRPFVTEILRDSNVRRGIPPNIETPPSVTPLGGYGQLLLHFSSSEQSAVISEITQFIVTLQMRNTTSETFSGGQYAAALMDNSGNIVSILGTVGSGSLSAGNRHTSTRNINCTVTPNSVPIGNYQLRILVRPNTTDGVWHIATLADTDVPDSIDFEIR